MLCFVRGISTSQEPSENIVSVYHDLPKLRVWRRSAEWKRPPSELNSIMISSVFLGMRAQTPLRSSLGFADSREKELDTRPHRSALQPVRSGFEPSWWGHPTPSTISARLTNVSWTGRIMSVADRGENVSIISCLFLLLKGCRNRLGMTQCKDVSRRGQESIQSMSRGSTGVQQISI